MPQSADWFSADWHTPECRAKPTGHIPEQGVQRTYGAVKASAKKGCQGCGILQQAMEAYVGKWTPRFLKHFQTEDCKDAFSDIGIGIWGVTNNLIVSFSVPFPDSYSTTLQIFTEPGETFPAETDNEVDALPADSDGSSRVQVKLLHRGRLLGTQEGAFSLPIRMSACPLPNGGWNHVLRSILRAF